MITTDVKYSRRLKDYNEVKFYVLIGRRIRKQRKLLNVTQLELSKALNIHCRTIKKFEHGDNCISAYNLLLISNILKIPIAELFRQSDIN